MTCLDTVTKFRDALLSDKSEDRYKVRADIIGRCDEVIAEFSEDPHNHYKLSYMYDWILSERKACSDSGHSAAMFYDKSLAVLQGIRGLDPSITLDSVCLNLVKHKEREDVPSDIRLLLQAMATFFE